MYFSSKEVVAAFLILDKKYFDLKFKNLQLISKIIFFMSR